MDIIYAIHDSHQLSYREPFGAVSQTSKIDMKIIICSRTLIEACELRVWENNSLEKYLSMNLVDKSSENDKFIYTYQISYRAPEHPGLVWYYFIIKNGDKKIYYGNNKHNRGGLGDLYVEEPPSYQITVYEPFKVSNWYKEGLMYQIFVDRFAKGSIDFEYDKLYEDCLLHKNWNDTPFYIREADNRIERWNFFGGNLQGIIDKLDYLKELNVTILYLNPIFKAKSNHKYDTADYMQIDPLFGDEKLFRKLIKEAEKRNINIILDGVFSHIGADSIYFNKFGNFSNIGAYQSKESPYYSWFKFKEFPDSYESWWGVDVMPNVNELEPSYMDFIFENDNSVIKYWTKLGVKGWRLDVVDELPELFVKGLKKSLKEVDDESVLIGEVWEDASNKISYGEPREYLLGRELDSTMNYPMRRIWIDFLCDVEDAKSTYNKTLSLYENYPKESFFSAMNLIGSHDVVRILTRLAHCNLDGNALTEKEKEKHLLKDSEKKLATKKLKLITLMQFFSPGIPCIYYGDEVGLEGFADPYNRKPFPWNNKNHGILEWYKKISSIRTNYKVFVEGEFSPLFIGSDVYGFIRQSHDTVAIILISRNEKDFIFIGDWFRKFYKDYFSTVNNNKILDLISGKEADLNSLFEFKLYPLNALCLICKDD